MPLDDNYDDVISAALPAKPRQPRPQPRPQPVGGLDPQFESQVNEIVGSLGQRGLKARIAEGYRTPQQQNDYYAQGRTKPGPIITYAQGTKGRHTSGHAADIDILDAQGRPLKNNDPTWKAIGEEAQKRGLTWGGNWPKLRDLRHVEVGGNAPAQDPYDDVIKAAIPQKAKQQPKSADPYDDVINAAISGQTPPPQSKLKRVTPQATASTPAGVSRQPSVPTAEQALKKIMDDVNRATGISQPRTQPRQAQAPFIDRTIPKMEDVLTAARNSPQTQREEQLAEPEFQRLKQQQSQQFGGTEFGRIAHPPKSDDELRAQATELAKEKVRQEQQQPAIDQLANKYRGLIQGVGSLAGMHGNAGPSKWTAEALTSAGAQVAPLLSFGLKAISNPKFSPVGALLTDSDKANAVATLVNKHATALQQAATAEGADRNEASKWAQSVISGTIASTPELAAMMVGVPAPAVFGAAGAAKSYGRGEPTAKNIEKGLEGTAQGLAWEAPALSGVKKLIPKSAMIGAGTTAVDLASGAPLGEALKGGATNALMALSGGRGGERSSLERGLERETPREAVEPNAEIAARLRGQNEPNQELQQGSRENLPRVAEVPAKTGTEPLAETTPRVEAESVAPQQALTPELSRKLANTKIRDEQGQPLKVYHGTASKYEGEGMAIEHPPEPLKWSGDDVAQWADRGTLAVRNQKTGKVELLANGKRKEFDSFEAAKEYAQSQQATRKTTERDALFFAENPIYARDFAKSYPDRPAGNDPRLLTAYLDLRNPLDSSKPESWEAVRPLVEKYLREEDGAVDPDALQRIREAYHEGNWAIIEAIPDMVKHLKAQGYDGYVSREGGALQYEGQPLDEYMEKGGADRSTVYAVFDPKAVHVSETIPRSDPRFDELTLYKPQQAQSRTIATEEAATPTTPTEVPKVETPTPEAQPKEPWEQTKKEFYGDAPTVYHGTTVDFDVFRPRYRKGEQLGFGIHFTPQLEFAEKYAHDPNVARRGKSPRVVEAQLNIKKPLRADEIVTEGSPEFELAKKLAGQRLMTQTDPQSGKKLAYLQAAIDGTSPQRAEKIIREAGYDAVTYKAKIIRGETPTSYSKHGEADTYIVFDDAQINSHRKQVEQAIREGKSVPSEVLKDYPDLAAKKPTTPTPTETAAPEVKGAEVPAEGTTREYAGKTYTRQGDKWIRADGRPVFGTREQQLNAMDVPAASTAKPTVTEPTKPETPKAATPELQRHADAAAELRARATDNLTGIEKAALERKAARLDAKARGEQLRKAGQDPYELIDDIIIHGGELIRAGKVKFDEWAKGIKDEFGKEADPHLKDVYAQLTGERKPTSIKNEATAELRHELDLTEMERPEKKSWETAIDNAEAKGLMDKTDEIADRIIKGNREEGLDYDESAALLVKTRELENKWEDTYKNNPNDPALNDIKAELDKVSKAVDMGGTDVARALGIRRAMMDKSFKLISLIRQAEKAKGRRVTADEVQRYDTIVKERDAAIAARDEALAQADAKASEVSTDKFIREQKLKIRQQGRQRKQSELVTERAEIKQQIAQAWAKIKPKTSSFGSAGIGDLDAKAIADMTRLLTQLARNHIESGVVKAVDLADAVHNEVKDVTDLSKREVSDLISGYGRVRKSTNDPIERKLNEIKSILAATSGKTDVLEEGIRPKRRGQQREKPTEDQRRALRELNEAMRERGPELGRQAQNKTTEQATPLDKAKTTVRNRIEQLNTWLKEGKKEVGGRSAIIPDVELTRLRAEQAGLERAARLLDDPAADAKAVEKRIGELDKSIAETQAKIRSGDATTKTAEGMSRWSKEIGEKQRELEVLKRIASDMRVDEARKAKEAAKAQEPAEPFYGAEMTMSDFDKEAKRSLARVKVLEKQRAEWERKLLAREFGEQAKTRTPPTYNAEVRRAEIRAQNAEAKFTKEMERAKGGHQIRNISGMMKASLLGPSTMVKNFFGTAGWQGFEEQGRVFASLMDNAISLGRQAVGKDAQRGIMGLSPSAVWEATKYGARVGGRQALDILKRGATVEQMEQHQYNEIDFGRTGNKAFDAGLKGMEVGFNSVFRILSASDRIFYQGAHRRNLIDRANVIARNEGLRGREAQQRARELVVAADAIPEKNAKGEKTSELVARLDADAKHDALVSTFNNDNTLSSKIRQFRAKVRNPRGAMSEKAADRVNALENLGMDFLVPFDRTPTNVVSRIVEASPLGYTKNVGQLVKAALNKGMDAEAQRNFSRTFGRASAGTVNMALGAALYGKLITIDDHDQAWLDLGFTKINLNTISPLGNIIGFGARMRKAYEKGDKATSGDYLKPALKEATNIPILRATQPIAEAAQQPDRSIPKTAARFVSMGIPFSGALRDIAKLTDKEDYRKPKGFTDTLKMGIPGLRQQVPVDADRKATVDPMIEQRRAKRLSDDKLDLLVNKGTISQKEAEKIKSEGDRSIQEVSFENIKDPQKALDSFQRMSVNERERVRKIMIKKAKALLYSESERETPTQKARRQMRLRQQFDRLGIDPDEKIEGGTSGMRRTVQSAFA